ncbi:MAG: protoheme IX farnesyltransferase [Leptospirales bacterium]|nr:protoheme IX farnesyltransferase [Leptospirales bacterium]
MKTGGVLDLLKPGIAVSVIITVIPGMLAGGQMPGPYLTAFTVIGTLFMAMSSFVYNQIMEIQTDSLMERTRNRPLVTGKVSLTQAHSLGAGLLAGGLCLLWFYATPLAALVALFSFLYYLFVYTLWLKPGTAQSTVFGGVCGALGPMIGQAAMENRIGTAGIMLFLLLFLWQPPHFWALAIAKREEYSNAQFPLLPVVHGVPATLRQMFAYQGFLIVATVLVTYPLSLAGFVFLIPSLLTALATMLLIVRLAKSPRESNAMHVFYASLVHNLTWHGAFALDLWLRIPAA